MSKEVRADLKLVTLFVGRGHAGLAINLGFAATDHTAGGWQRLRCANLRLRYNLQNPRGRAELILPLVPRVASGWLRFSSRAAGIKAIGTAGSDEGLQLVKKRGCASGDQAPLCGLSEADSRHNERMRGRWDHRDAGEREPRSRESVYILI